MEGRSSRGNTKFAMLMHSLWKQRTMQLMAIPGIIFLFIFAYLPMPGIIIAFKNYRLIHTIWSAPWAANHGFEHFIRFFTSGDLVRVVRNTLTLSIMSTVITFPLPILFALCLNEVRSNVLKRSVQTMTYFPHFLSWVVLGGITINWLAEGGLVNQTLKALGWIETDIFFLAEPSMFYPIVIITSIWKELGWSAIIYLAAIAGIDQEMYEAATIDGASRLKKAIHISLPAITPIVTLMLILRVANLFGNNFDQILVLRNQLNAKASDVIDIFVYIRGMGVTGSTAQEYSFATAVGLFRSVVSVILLLCANFAANKINGEGLF